MKKKKKKKKRLALQKRRKKGEVIKEERKGKKIDHCPREKKEGSVSIGRKKIGLQEKEKKRGEGGGIKSGGLLWEKKEKTFPPARGNGMDWKPPGRGGETRLKGGTGKRDNYKKKGGELIQTEYKRTGG